jgi:FAD:protein FMN transferase
MALMAPRLIDDNTGSAWRSGRWHGNAGSLDFLAMGTRCRVMFSASSRVAVADFESRVLAWISGFENRYSRFKTDSLISRINNNAGREWVTIDDELKSILALCDWYHWATKGVFDPSALPVMKLWDYRVTRPVVPDDAAVRKALELTGWAKVQRDDNRIFLPIAGMGIDIGGLGKEYAVDRVMDAARDSGVDDILIDFGHDIRVRGAPAEGGPWKIGIEDPFDPGQCKCGVAVSERAVATSGDYIRNFESDGRRYGHIIDPRTGYPVNNSCRSVSVIAPTCTEAGMIAKTAFIMGADEGIDLIHSFVHAEGCIVTDTGTSESRRFYEYEIQNKSVNRRRREAIA